jgi:hypothetical protein
LSSQVIEFSEIERAQARARAFRRVFPWLALVCILVVYVIAVLQLHPANFFGYVHDDTIYLSSAHAIADGDGYILPSIPGTPRPWLPVLYPWVLSWVWRWNPSFPANFKDALAVNIFCALVYIALGFAFLRQLGGIKDYEALIIICFCALHPIVLFYGANVVTELPFAALVLGAIVLADKCSRAPRGVTWVVLCGILAGLCSQMRIIGIAIPVGIAIALMLRKHWRQFAIFCFCSGAFLLPLAWHLYRGRAEKSAVESFGWTRTWTYYTSYLGFWRMNFPNSHAVSTIPKNNFATLVRTPSDYLLFPALVPSTFLGIALSAVLTAMILAGIVRQARKHGWKPVHLIVPFYTLIAIIWSFNEDYRFFIPFMPLFMVGYWNELRHLLTMVRKAALKNRPISDRILARVFAVGFVVLTAAILWNYLAPARTMISEIGRARAALLSDKREAYDWIERSTPTDARVIAYDDGSLYLYTGRQAVRPIIFTAADFFEPNELQLALEHMADVAKAVRAGYWMDADDDFHLESSHISQKAVRRENEILRGCPLVFSSADGRVRIYSLACIVHMSIG